MAEIKIRDNPKLRSFLRDITEAGFTGVMWGLWMYLILPVINIILWILGIRYFRISMVEKTGYEEVLGLIGKMGWLVLAVFLIMRLWGYYNYMKYGRKSRRSGNVPVTAEQIAEQFDLTPETVRDMQARKEIFWQSARAEDKK